MDDFKKDERLLKRSSNEPLGHHGKGKPQPNSKAAGSNNPGPKKYRETSWQNKAYAS